MRWATRAPASGGGPALLLACVAAGCVDDARPEAAPVAPIVAVWDIPLQGKLDGTALWPKGPGAPAGRRRHVETESDAERLRLKVDGPDPWIVWRFETEIRAAALRVEVESASVGRLQLFWTTLECPTFAERCSATAELAPGDRIVAFLLDERRPIRELRLDLPDSPGARLSFRSITVLARGLLDSTWTGREEHSSVETTALGLRLTAAAADPWMIVATPGLVASRVTSIELELHGSTGPPQLFWDGPCGHFAEACSVVLTPVDAGATTHSADLRALPKWTGSIGNLRLDPGPDPGTYWIDRIALVRSVQ